jgi:hypothetical protein
VSLFLPGFDQYLEGQYPYALGYTGIGLAGIGLIKKSQKPDPKSHEHHEDSYGYEHVGASLYSTAGFISAYHSFKTAARTRPDDFSFIEKEDSLKDIFLAPFDFSHIIKPTTFIPLGIITAGMVAFYKHRSHRPHYARGTTERGIATVEISYGAGVGEEAAFRGWLLPVSHYGLNSPLLGNLTQGTVFGLLHYSPKNRMPVIQTALGVYFGWVTQRNGYSIQETTFQHFWWDTIVLGTALLLNINQKTKIPLQLPMISIPL